MKYRIIWVTIFVWWIISCGTTQNIPSTTKDSLSIHDAMATAATKLAPNKSTRIAIFPFPERGMGPTLLGEFVADKLMVALGAKGNVIIVERSRLDTIRKEQGLGVLGELDDATAADVGNLAGAEAVIVGTLTNLGNGSWDLTARLLGATNAAMIATVETQFTETSLPPNLAGKLVAYTSESGPLKKTSGSKSSSGLSNPETKRSQSSKEFGQGESLHEDFSDIAVGDFAVDWGPNCTVFNDKETRRNYITVMSSGKHICGKEIWFPTDFVFKYKLRFTKHCELFILQLKAAEGDPVYLQLDGGNGCWYEAMLSRHRPLEGLDAKLASVRGNKVVSTIHAPMPSTEREQWYELKITKKGTALKCFLDDQYMVSMTLPEDIRFIGFSQTISEKLQFTDFEITELQ